MAQLIQKLQNASRNTATIRALVIIVALALIVLSLRLPTFAITAATVLLLYVTCEYVLANQEYVRLTRHQMERQEQVYVQFGLRDDAVGDVYVWAANLGVSSFLISGVQARERAKPTIQAWRLNWILPVGELKNEIYFDPKVYDSYPRSTFVWIDVSLRCRGIVDDHQTAWRGFTIHRSGMRNIVYGGFKGVWAVSCPSCNRSDAMAMNLNDLTNLDEAWTREQELKQELSKSCPKHNSKWLLASDPKGS